MAVQLLVGERKFIRVRAFHRLTGQKVDPHGVVWEVSDQAVVECEGEEEGGAWLTGRKAGNATVEARFTSDLGDGVRGERVAVGVAVRNETDRTGAWIEEGAPEEA